MPNIYWLAAFNNFSNIKIARRLHRKYTTTILSTPPSMQKGSNECLDSLSFLKIRRHILCHYRHGASSGATPLTYCAQSTLSMLRYRIAANLLTEQCQTLKCSPGTFMPSIYDDYFAEVTNSPPTTLTFLAGYQCQLQLFTPIYNLPLDAAPASMPHRFSRDILLATITAVAPHSLLFVGHTIPPPASIGSFSIKSRIVLGKIYHFHAAIKPYLRHTISPLLLTSDAACNGYASYTTAAAASLSYYVSLILHFSPLVLS